MKIRSRKTNRNSRYELDDFLLKEFSKDKETFIADTELSCNECDEQESVAVHRDSPLSFLVKFKMDNSKDPKAIRGITSGFILPPDLTYEHQPSESLFSSVAQNHYNLRTTETKLRNLAAQLFADDSMHIGFKKDEVKSYLCGAVHDEDWHNALARPDRTKWRAFVAKALKAALVADYGPIEATAVEEALAIDSEGYLARVRTVREYGGFNEAELSLLGQYKSEGEA